MNRSSSDDMSGASFFFVTSMMTTVGAIISNTFVKALLSWWTTSLPASAAAGGAVEVGPVSGCESGGAADKDWTAARRMTRKADRMVSDLDRGSTIAVQSP